MLFEIEGDCSINGKGKYTNPICIEPGGIDDGAAPSKFSLWTHMGAAGPFTNSRGQPLDDLPMKCVCESIDDSIAEDQIDFFTVKLFTPTECSRKRLFGWKPGQGVTCDGSFAKPPQGKTGDLIDKYKAQGVNTKAFKRVSFFEERQLIFLGIPDMFASLMSYNLRNGFTEWPYISKWPFVANNSCPEKGATPLPYPVYSYAPYTFGGDIRETTPDGTAPLDSIRHHIGLCALYHGNKFFCPSHQNADLKPVIKWDYSRFHPHGIFADDR
jgi:hypothetical protein